MQARGKFHSNPLRTSQLGLRHTGAQLEEFTEERTVFLGARWVVRRMRGHRLRGTQQQGRFNDARQTRHLDLDNARAQALQQLQRLLDRRGLAGVDTRESVLTVETDAQPFHPSPDVAVRVRRRLAKGRGISGIDARDRIEHDGHIGDSSRHGPHVIE